MDEYDRQAYLDDGEDPDDPAIIARHEFVVQALRSYGIALGIRRECGAELVFPCPLDPA